MRLAWTLKRKAWTARPNSAGVIISFHGRILMISTVPVLSVSSVIFRLSVPFYLYVLPVCLSYYLFLCLAKRYANPFPAPLKSAFFSQVVLRLCEYSFVIFLFFSLIDHKLFWFHGPALRRLEQFAVRGGNAATSRM